MDDDQNETQARPPTRFLTPMPERIGQRPAEAATTPTGAVLESVPASPRMANILARMAAADEEELEVFIIALQPRHAEYLRQRAANHGEAPERHLETILRNFRSYYDDRRPEHRASAPELGQPAITRRV